MFPMVTKAELREYGGAVIRQWYAFVIGIAAIIALVIQTLANATGLRLWPWWMNLVLFGVAIHWGQLLAWCEMKRERDALRKYNVSQASLDKLALYRDQLISMQNEDIKTEVDLGSWKERYQRLRDEIIQYVSVNISPAESKRFTSVGLFAIYHISNQAALNDEHIKQRSMIARDYFWLDKCVQDYSRRKLRPGAASQDDGESSLKETTV
jgi:hypothetical protein